MLSMPGTPTRDRLDPKKINTTPLRRPEWIRIAMRKNETQLQIHTLMRSKTLHSVCEEACCPNLNECWNSGTATFLILGSICTRACGFCDIRHGKPLPLDRLEPVHVAEAVEKMGLKHVVITSVNRDELKDGGASVFAEVIHRIHQLSPDSSVEVLIPDFRGDIAALSVVLDAGPDILNHNLETVPRLFKTVQPQDRLEWSRDVLVNSKRVAPGVITKSGIMVGLGETIDEIKSTMQLLRSWDVDILTIGQYLQPSRRHLPISRYYHPSEFEDLKRFGVELGFYWVESAPLVRSSYHAHDQIDYVRSRRKIIYNQPQA